MKKYTKDQILEIVNKAVEEAMQQVISTNEPHKSEPENRFLAILMEAKDIALLEAVKTSIERELL